MGTDGVGVHKFLGIPFAQPPVGNLRFQLPHPIEQYEGTYDASKFGQSCPQHGGGLPSLGGLAAEAADWLSGSIFNPDRAEPSAEDCLTLNVMKPDNATPDSQLPVLVWIYGGGFSSGSTNIYDGGIVVRRSKELGKPVVFVSMNYRVSAYGFLASKEVMDAGIGNLGLQDQREALRWVQKNIAQFGGDPAKVSLWGESAGAISAALHMMANGGNTEGLFRGAFMQSGGPIPVGSVANGQVYYDQIVASTGCSGSADTLQCLREVAYDRLKAAVDGTPGTFSYQALRLAFLPRVDGTFITDEPFKLVQEGKVAPIPFVTGNVDDEGTLFSLALLNVTTNNDFKGWLRNFWPKITESQVEQVADAYPNDITKGSPFDTFILNALTPQFKRLAAFQGDGVFQAPRRFLLKYTSSKQKTWAFLSKRFKALPVLGSVHASDLANSFFIGKEMQDHIIYFANNLDPNGPSVSTNWPQYTTDTKQLLVYRDNLLNRVDTTTDDYRSGPIELLTNLAIENPI